MLRLLVGGKADWADKPLARHARTKIFCNNELGGRLNWEFQVNLCSLKRLGFHRNLTV